jgi:hypothetical protein
MRAGNYFPGGSRWKSRWPDPGLYTQIRDRVSRASGGVWNVRKEFRACQRQAFELGVRDRAHRAHLRKLQKKLDYKFL